MTGRQNPAHGQAHNGHEYCPLSILPEVYRFKRPNGVMAMTKKCCPRCEATAIPLTPNFLSAPAAAMGDREQPKPTDPRPSISDTASFAGRDRLNTPMTARDAAFQARSHNGQAVEPPVLPRRRKKQIGNMFVLCSYADGTPILIAGPCWPFCVFVTLPLIMGVAGLVSFFLIFDDRFGLPSWLIAIYGLAVGAVLFSLFCVSCRDPGLMDRVVDEEAGQGGWFWNEQVGSFRPPGALYCRECAVLIQDYDHLIGLLCWALLDGLAS
ncbi:predicted protein [Phaeodactylum tricornutum CCAP 1055/1]|uniref:Uncharacterized protein n=4 Tax=Phaeodactylum tricornutum TaxID=2850 RepID=B7G3D0_PHATC|nr:predicted protein [Phaeodactylum tricornutum CCAP 1055/1]EEC46979.1 predicted protein [Phaeodactylum tricornutum CCAP 1055/1]|eukprot:XP_002181765.1 predicted protein [Phaeodactylum tricornutum CCAP 1055/1]